MSSVVMSSILALLLLCTTLCSAQFLYNQPADALGHYHNALPVTQNFAHPAVVQNAYHESQLPPELSKSDRFYKNPRIAAALAKSSWFTEKEMPVIDREADKIPRDMVYKLIKNAGYIKRR